MVRAPDSSLKGCRFNERQENFLLQGQLSVLTLILVSVHPCDTTVACKDPSHSARSAGSRLQLSMHVP